MENPWMPIGVGMIVFGLMLIAAAIGIAVFLTDWPAVRALPGAVERP